MCVCLGWHARSCARERCSPDGRTCAVHWLTCVPPVPPTPFRAARMWTIEDDLLTPTFKLKRPQMQKKFQEQVRAGGEQEWFESCR